ncbi:KAP family P-loop NTPase fold protein [Pseudoalteromonas luteoviolacea]|uniref:KAP family P-loop NTPase fold protein n=1 Tax=Pseudoalteromonas luteoviolacea TaxID=43657 RepID=UPI001B3925D1|nr:P-loop NTPase fold protein [Pseudoalteromonas luteoviolacea]MBQ4836539.1 AAA family ATPase [Pseudoalteromonas luteoviolacea]
MKGFLSDTPVSSLENWPELQSFASYLAENLNKLDNFEQGHQNTELINTAPILLSGDWGSGKTSLLMCLKKELNDKNVVWLDAWRYEAESSLMTALLHCIWQSQPEPNNAKQQALNAFKAVLKTAASLGVRGMLGAIGIKGNLTDIQKDFDTISQVETQPPVKTQTDLLTEQFEELINTLWEDNKPIIIIDDLDRCSPESAVELLDQIRLLVSSHTHTGCRFVVAMDKVTLQQAIRSKFSSLSSYDSQRYLEKLFPIMLQIPRFSLANHNTLYQELLSQGGYHDDQDNTDSGLRFDEKWKDVFSTPCFANLRLIKRCLNTYQWLMSNEPESQTPPFDTALLMEWLAAINRWPTLRDYLHAKSNVFWEQVENALQHDSVRSENQDATVDELLEQPYIREFFNESPTKGGARYEYRLQTRIQDYKVLDEFISSKGV